MKEEKHDFNDLNENEKIHDGTDSDGIKELDNPAPNWILLILLFTYGFSLFYAIHYFGYPNNGKDQVSEYNRRISEAQVARNQTQNDSNGGVVLGKEEAIAEGAKLFTQKGCIACHGMNGEGNKIGPNLTDNYWINGCSQEKLIAIVTEGKPEKGMTPFKTMLTPDQIKYVVTYIKEKVVGSNPANAKEKQGEECKP